MPGADLRETILNEIANGATPKECSEKHNISAGTIRSWVSRAKAKGEMQPQRNAAKKEKVATKKAATQRKSATNKKSKKEVPEIEIRLRDVDEKLTEKQRLFCFYYIRNFNATVAATRAGYSQKTAYSIGYDLLRNPEVRKEIDRLKEIRAESILVKEADIVEKHMRIAFSDMTDFVEFGQEEVPVMGPFGPLEIKNDETGEKIAITQVINTLRFKESAEVDGGIIKEVKVGRNGASVKLYDAQDSLKWLERYFEINPMDRHKKRYDEERLRLEEEKIKLQREANKEKRAPENNSVMIVDDIDAES